MTPGTRQRTILLLLGVPDLIVDAIMGWEGGAVRMRTRYMHVTDPMLRDVAKQVGGALWVVAEKGD